MFTTIDADKLPKQLKDNAKEIHLERGMYKGAMKDLQKGCLFEFVVIAEHPVKANDISEAMAEFVKQHPDFDLKDLQYVRYNGKRLPYVYSSETMERIYYMSGCPCGETDCIHDPMPDIARSCKHQSDMTPTNGWSAMSRWPRQRNVRTMMTNANNRESFFKVWPI